MQIDLWHRWRIPEQRVDYDSRLIICPSAFSPLWSTRWPPKIRLKRIRIRRSFAKSVSWRTTRIVLIVAKKDQHMSTQPSELSFVRRVLAFCKYENHISNILLLTVSGKKAAIGELRLSISWSVQFIVILIQFCFVPLKSTLFLLISVVNRAVPKILNFVFWTRWKKIVCTFMREISDGFCDYRRGLNPPHRVKSISMGTFQDDEVKFMQLRGNAVSACPSNHIASSSLLTNNRLNKSCFFLQFCKNAWLWNFDPQTGPRPPEVRDDQKMKDFLAVKYEKKKWYHPAHDTQMADQLKQQDDSSSYGSLRGTDSESSLSRRTSTNSQRSQKTPDSANAFNTDSPVQRHAPISLVSWRFVGRLIYWSVAVEIVQLPTRLVSVELIDLFVLAEIAHCQLDQLQLRCAFCWKVRFRRLVQCLWNTASLLQHFPAASSTHITRWRQPQRFLFLVFRLARMGQLCQISDSPSLHPVLATSALTSSTNSGQALTTNS